MPPGRSEIPVSLFLKPRDFVINTDDPVVVNYVGGLFEVVFEAGVVKYLSVWKLVLRQLFKIAFIGTVQESIEEDLIVLKIVCRHVVDQSRSAWRVVKDEEPPARSQSWGIVLRAERSTIDKKRCWVFQENDVGINPAEVFVLLVDTLNNGPLVVVDLSKPGISIVGPILVVRDPLIDVKEGVFSLLHRVK